MFGGQDPPSTTKALCHSGADSQWQSLSILRLDLWPTCALVLDKGNSARGDSVSIHLTSLVVFLCYYVRFSVFLCFGLFVLESGLIGSLFTFGSLVRRSILHAIIKCTSLQGNIEQDQSKRALRGSCDRESDELFGCVDMESRPPLAFWHMSMVLWTAQDVGSMIWGCHEFKVEDLEEFCNATSLPINQPSQPP